MKILTNKQYDLICEIVMEAKMKAEMLEVDNKELQNEIKTLKESNLRLKYLLDKEFASDKVIDFPNSSLEVWNGPKGQTIQPKGTFEKIFNDPDADQVDKSF